MGPVNDWPRESRPIAGWRAPTTSKSLPLSSAWAAPINRGVWRSPNGYPWFGGDTVLESLKLQEIAQAISSRFEEVDAAREKGLVFGRKVIKLCSLAIRAVHRREFDEADNNLAQAKELLEKCNQTLSAHPEVYYSGFLQDAEKEYAE